MNRYWRAAVLGICRGSREAGTEPYALCLVPGKVNQKPVEASSMSLLTAQPCRDPAFLSSCPVIQAGARGANPQMLCLFFLLRGSAAKLSFPRQLAVVPQTWDCGFTAGWGSSVGWGGRGKGTQGKLAGSESRRGVHPLQKTSRSQSLAFSCSQPVSHV